MSFFRRIGLRRSREPLYSNDYFKKAETAEKTPTTRQGAQHLDVNYRVNQQQAYYDHISRIPIASPTATESVSKSTAAEIDGLLRVPQHAETATTSSNNSFFVEPPTDLYRYPAASATAEHSTVFDAGHLRTGHEGTSGQGYQEHMAFTAASPWDRETGITPFGELEASSALNTHPPIQEHIDANDFRIHNAKYGSGHQETEPLAPRYFHSMNEEIRPDDIGRIVQQVKEELLPLVPGQIFGIVMERLIGDREENLKIAAERIPEFGQFTKLGEQYGGRSQYGESSYLIYHYTNQALEAIHRRDFRISRNFLGRALNLCWKFFNSSTDGAPAADKPPPKPNSAGLIYSLPSTSRGMGLTSEALTLVQTELLLFLAYTYNQELREIGMAECIEQAMISCGSATCKDQLNMILGMILYQGGYVGQTVSNTTYKPGRSTLRPGAPPVPGATQLNSLVPIPATDIENLPIALMAGRRYAFGRNITSNIQGMRANTTALIIPEDSVVQLGVLELTKHALANKHEERALQLAWCLWKRGIRNVSAEEYLRKIVRNVAAMYHGVEVWGGSTYPQVPMRDRGIQNAMVQSHVPNMGLGHPQMFIRHTYPGGHMRIATWPQTMPEIWVALRGSESVPFAEQQQISERLNYRQGDNVEILVCFNHDNNEWGHGLNLRNRGKGACWMENFEFLPYESLTDKIQRLEKTDVVFPLFVISNTSGNQELCTCKEGPQKPSGAPDDYREHLKGHNGKQYFSLSQCVRFGCGRPVSAIKSRLMKNVLHKDVEGALHLITKDIDTDTNILFHAFVEASVIPLDEGDNTLLQSLLWYLACLLFLCADVDYKNGYGESPLHIAVLSWYRTDVVEFLLRNKADVNAVNNLYETPLAYVQKRDRLWNTMMDTLDKNLTVEQMVPKKKSRKGIKKFTERQKRTVEWLEKKKVDYDKTTIKLGSLLVENGGVC
ncbi:hypothetical protein ABW19_dt0203566 [Dactylella cylindrospora]|nr:hypothetical protein ABW19_dt0203566 [Dactylella cylindrospora]